VRRTLLRELSATYTTTSAVRSRCCRRCARARCPGTVTIWQLRGSPQIIPPSSCTQSNHSVRPSRSSGTTISDRRTPVKRSPRHRTFVVFPAWATPSYTIRATIFCCSRSKVAIVDSAPRGFVAHQGDERARQRSVVVQEEDVGDPVALPGDGRAPRGGADDVEAHPRRHRGRHVERVGGPAPEGDE